MSTSLKELKNIVGTKKDMTEGFKLQLLINFASTTKILLIWTENLRIYTLYKFSWQYNSTSDVQNLQRNTGGMKTA